MSELNSNNKAKKEKKEEKNKKNEPIIKVGEWETFRNQLSLIIIIIREKKIKGEDGV